MIDTFLAVGQMLESLGYNELASYLVKNKESSFLSACVNIVLHKTPLEHLYQTRGNLYICGAITDAP